MSIKIPTLKELSQDEQLQIFNLPFDNNYLILGSAGTGKTILALLRALQWNRNGTGTNKKCTFLVFNAPLQMMLQKTIENNPDLNDKIEAMTFHQWIYRYLKKLNLDPHSYQYQDYQYDFDRLIPTIEKEGVRQPIDYLILDEGQDLNKDMVKALSVITKSATVFADPNQSNGNKTAKRDLTRAFDMGSHVYYLTKNFRNTKEVASVANLFHTGDEEEIPKVPDNRTGEKPSIYRCDSKEEMRSKILHAFVNNPSDSIAVILPNKSEVKPFYRHFIHDCKKDEIDTSKVQYYIRRFDEPFSESGNNLNTFDSGLLIISQDVVKGLQFNTVFIYDICNPVYEYKGEYENYNIYSELNKMYIATSRAEEKLVFLYDKEDYDSFVLKKLKENKNFLTWLPYRG